MDIPQLSSHYLPTIYILSTYYLLKIKYYGKYKRISKGHSSVWDEQHHRQVSKLPDGAPLHLYAEIVFRLRYL